jgi:undecaprenyl-diphosphatase
VITYLQAIVLGLLQGVTELFPISSLGHSVLVPALIGGSWQELVTQSDTASGSSPYLAFIVALHVATALALLVFFRSDWVRIIRGFVRTLRPSWAARRIVARDADERLAWLLVIGTIPVGITGLILEHLFRTLFAKPLAAAVFLTLNGLILLAGEWLRRKAPVDEPESGEIPVHPAAQGDPTATMPISVYSHAGPAPAGRQEAGVPARERGRRRLTTLSYKEAGVIGIFQTFALLAGISRSGITMVGGLARGLSHRDAAHFSFLLATPVILAAGALKLGDLAGPLGNGIRPQVIFGSVLSGVGAYLAVRFLTRYFAKSSMRPFGYYCLIAGIASVIRFAIF